MGAGRPSILLEEKYLTLRQFLHFVSKLILASSSNKIVSSHITARKQSLGQGNADPYPRILIFRRGLGSAHPLGCRPSPSGCRPLPPGHVACDACWEANLLPP